MKKIFLFFCFAGIMAFIGMTASATARDTKPLLTDKSAWSFVTAKPAKNWTTQFPLPKSEFCIGEMHTEKKWPAGKPVVWMTSRVVLPEDYKPANLFIKFMYDDDIAIFINGTLIYQGIGPSQHVTKGKKRVTNWKGGGQTVRYDTNCVTRHYTKQIPSLLKPGENVVAVMVANVGGLGVADVTMWTDDSPLLDIQPVLAVDGKWSYTLDDPGANWETRSPLPKGKVGYSPFSTQRFWTAEKANIWMTHVVTVTNLNPGELLVQYMCDDNMWLYINGKRVLFHQNATNDWTMKRNVENLLKPGKNIIAVRCENTNPPYQAFIGVDLFYRELAAGEQLTPALPPAEDEHPLGYLRDDADQQEEEEPAVDLESLSETDKQILRAMECFKVGQDPLAVAALQKVVEEDANDFQANCILGNYYLTKLYKRAEAFEYFKKAAKVAGKNPAVLNNYGVAAIENKEFASALKAWQRLEKIDATPMEFAQNVACLMDLMNQKRVTLKEAEQLQLVDLYIRVCAGTNRERDVNCGFLLMPLGEGVGNRPDCEAAFVQEIKVGRGVSKGKPYEVKRTYFMK